MFLWNITAAWKRIICMTDPSLKHFMKNMDHHFFDTLWASPGVPHFPGLGLFTLDTGYDEVCKRLYENASSYDSNDYWFEQNMIGIDYNYEDNSDQYKYVVLVEDVYGRDEVQKVYTNNVKLLFAVIV